MHSPPLKCRDNHFSTPTMNAPTASKSIVVSDNSVLAVSEVQSKRKKKKKQRQLASNVPLLCHFFTTNQGCRSGASCTFSHGEATAQTQEIEFPQPSSSEQQVAVAPTPRRRPSPPPTPLVFNNGSVWGPVGQGRSASLLSGSTSTFKTTRSNSKCSWGAMWGIDILKVNHKVDSNPTW